MNGATLRHLRPVLVSRMQGDGVKQVRDFKCLDESRFDNVSMGTRPSGTLHQGNLFVLATCMHYLRINSRARVNVDIMDLDFDNQRGPVFTPYTYLSSTRDFINQLRMAVEMIAKSLKVDPNSVNITYFSEKLESPESALRKMILRLAKDREGTKSVKFAMNDRPGRYDRPAISLICDTCNQAGSDFARYRSVDDRFASVCKNPTCPTKDFEADLSSGMFNVHYLLDPVRDLMLAPSTLHIFGGDYGQACGMSKTAKFMRVAAVMEAAKVFLQLETELPSFFITPMILDNQGNKVSKSLCNGGNPGTDIARYLQEEISKVVKIMELCIDGTLSGITLLGPKEAAHAF